MVDLMWNFWWNLPYGMFYFFNRAGFFLVGHHLKSVLFFVKNKVERGIDLAASLLPSFFTFGACMHIGISLSPKLRILIAGKVPIQIPKTNQQLVTSRQWPLKSKDDHGLDSSGLFMVENIGYSAAAWARHKVHFGERLFLLVKVPSARRVSTRAGRSHKTSSLCFNGTSRNCSCNSSLNAPNEKCKTSKEQH